MTRRRYTLAAALALALAALTWHAGKAVVVLRDRPQWADDFDRYEGVR